MCDKGYAWNPSNCEHERDKACNVGENLHYKNCKCRKKLVAPLIEECAKTVEVKIAKINLAKNENENSCKYSSCTVYIVLLLIFFTINVSGIVTYYVYSHWDLKKDDSHVTFNTYNEKKIY